MTTCYIPEYFLYKGVASGEEVTKNKITTCRARVWASKTPGLAVMEIKVNFFVAILSFDVVTDRLVHSPNRVEMGYA